MDAALISSLRKPAANARVFKEECMFSFITHAAPDGIFVNLQTFQVRYQCHRAFWGHVVRPLRAQHCTCDAMLTCR